MTKGQNKPATKKDLNKLEKNLKKDIASARQKDLVGLEKRIASVRQKDLVGLEKRIASVRQKDLVGLEKRIASARQKDLVGLEKNFDNKLSGFKFEIDMKLDDQFTKMKDMTTEFRNDIYNLVDGVVGEIKTNREERTIMGHQLSQHDKKITDHGDRIDALEKIKTV